MQFRSRQSWVLKYFRGKRDGSYCNHDSDAICAVKITTLADLKKSPRKCDKSHGNYDWDGDSFDPGKRAKPPVFFWGSVPKTCARIICCCALVVCLCPIFPTFSFLFWLWQLKSKVLFCKTRFLRDAVCQTTKKFWCTKCTVEPHTSIVAETQHMWYVLEKHCKSFTISAKISLLCWKTCSVNGVSCSKDITQP